MPGFTTREAETIVNYPIRRRIVSVLMIIGKILKSMTILGKRNFQRLLQIGDDYSVCEHFVGPHLLHENGNLIESDIRIWL